MTNPLVRETPKISAYAIKKPVIVATLEDLYQIRFNPVRRLTASPFAELDSVFYGRAAPHKLGPAASRETKTTNLGRRRMTIDEFASYAEKIGVPGVASGLRKAVEISKACEGVKGTVRIGNRYLPKKVICQIQKSPKAVKVPVAAPTPE